jgi:hypothetical protein
MTRREEIAKQAEITVFPWDEPQEQNKFQDGFIEGAKWADKTMIEKVCKWLKSHIKFETVNYSDVWISAVDILATDFNTIDEMEESLRKAMEE